LDIGIWHAPCSIFFNEKIIPSLIAYLALSGRHWQRQEIRLTMKAFIGDIQD
jgi:hypothetical protein